MPKLKLSAVTIPAMRTTVFVVDFAPESLPASVDWSDWTIEDDIHLVVPADLYSWPDGANAPGLAILCRPISNPKRYEMFKRSADVPETEFDRTPMAYGGVYSESHWEGFVQDFPRILKFLQVPDGDPPGVWEEVPPTMKRGH